MPVVLLLGFVLAWQGGLIAFDGLDAETGVVMLLHLDHASDNFRDQGRMNTMGDLRVAVSEVAS